MPHLIYLAYGFPPAAKSGSYRMRAVANAFAARGWDVSAVSLADDSWHRETGLDRSTLDGLHPRIRRVGLPLSREDLEPDLALWSRARAADPDGWRDAFFERSRQPFPEKVFGLWREAYEQAVVALHAERPADLLMASPMPYVTLAAARHLHRTAGVPYVIDYRDGWSLDVVSGEVAFDADSSEGAIETDVLEHAAQVWFVNQRIRDVYAERYPAVGDRMRVVRNGFDPDLLAQASEVHPATPPLTFGYLGTMTLGLPQLTALLDGWRLARSSDPVLEGARLEFRGHMGAGYAAGAGGHAALVAARAAHGVSYGGPVSKAEVREVYRHWDALVLALIGGRYVTSGKVYEYLATGLPILSAHQADHAAAEVLEGYPLWAPAVSLEAEDLAQAFVRTAHLALEADDRTRQAARAHAEQYTRSRLIDPAVDEAIALVPAPAASPPAPAEQPAPAEGPTEQPGRSVLLVAAARVVPVALRAVVPALQEAGHTVRLVSREDPRAAVAGLDLPARRLAPGPVGRPARLSPAWVRGQWRRRVTARLVRGRPAQHKTWALLRADGTAWQWAAEADVVVALDRYAALAAWHLRRRRGVTALLGLTEARYRLVGG